MHVPMETFDEEFLAFIAKKELRIPVDSVTQKTIGLHTRSWRANPSPTQQTIHWMPALGTGTVISYVIFHRQYSAQFPLPHIVGMVELTEGLQLLGRIDTMGDDQPVAGLAVTACFDKKGLIFRPTTALQK